jgi:hypothetical protein
MRSEDRRRNAVALLTTGVPVVRADGTGQRDGA